VGTGLNCPEGFAEAVAEHIAQLTSLPFATAPNKFAALAAHDALVFTSGALSQLACAAMKIANDVRWLASGPRAGLGELHIPENEPGSSIMPGKVNPTQCEALIMVAGRVLGNHHSIAFAGSQGNFELNVAKPLIANALLESVRLLSDALTSFDRHCALGIEPILDVMAEHVQRSLMLATALNGRLGYDGASSVARYAAAHNTTLRESAIALHAMSGEDFDEVVRPERMLHPTPRA
jgi:fumarate hydratase class II